MAALGRLDTYLDCVACKHFDGEAFKSTGRACRKHDFLMPRAGHSFVCRDLDCTYGDQPELVQLDSCDPGVLLYSSTPYLKKLYPLAAFAQLQRRVFGVDFAAGRHFDKQFEFPEYVFPLGLVQAQWKPLPERETRLSFDGRSYPARITVATDLRNNDTQPQLHSEAALPELLEWSGFNRVMVEFKKMNWPFKGYAVFLECAEDLSEFRVIRDAVWEHMPAEIPALQGRAWPTK